MKKPVFVPTVPSLYRLQTRTVLEVPLFREVSRMCAMKRCVQVKSAHMRDICRYSGTLGTARVAAGTGSEQQVQECMRLHRARPSPIPSYFEKEKESSNG